MTGKDFSQPWIVLIVSGALALPLQAQSYTFQVLHRFEGAPSDGGELAGTLIRGANGSFYGPAGGGEWNYGCVFKMSPKGSVTLLYSFTGGADGGAPVGSLAQDQQGNFYGAASGGGNLTCGSVGITQYCGVVYELDSSSVETVLYAFTGGADGGQPTGGVVRDRNGNLYGTTHGGGTGSGVVFKMDPVGHETVLYTFTGGVDGGSPEAGLIRDGAGSLYGTTPFGGQYGYGVVFKVDPAGKETVLYSFTGGADGGLPYAGLVMDSAGNLYGTTVQGGIAPFDSGLGVVYKLDKGGTQTVLHAFASLGDGANPYSGVVLDSAGNIYGTTYWGGDAGEGSSGGGVVYRIDTSGNETLLHKFTGGTNGALLQVGLLLTPAGDLYGGTLKGGDKGNGVMFKLAP